MLYNKPTFIYPPQAELSGNPAIIGEYDTGEFLAQIKYNGDGVEVIMTESSLDVYNRHGGIYTKLKPGIITRDLYRGPGVQIIVGEYLSKNQPGEYGRSLNDSFVIWDILVHNSEYLVGSTFKDRLLLLDQLYPSSMSEIANKELFIYDFIRTTSIYKTYRAATFENGFEEEFKRAIKIDLYEGFILKKTAGILAPGNKEKNNDGWQLKFLR